MIVNPIANIPVNKKSHVYGWSKKWSDLLNIKIDHKCAQQHGTAYIDHGANFSGTLNLFGGANKDVFDRINRVMAADTIISLDHEMPNYGEMLRKRIGAKTTHEGITEDWCNKLSARCKQIKSLKMEELFTTSQSAYSDYTPIAGITVGDSHTIAYADKWDAIFRNDGKTLHGALKEGLNTFMRGALFNKADTDTPVTFCFGSIDIRHHICRHGGLSKSMIETYIDQAYSITNNPFFAKPVPVEFTGRRIPKTGFYKGEPFYGTLEDRQNITNEFIMHLQDLLPKEKIVGPPEEWYRMDPEKYAKTYMELSSSFHIAPLYYRSENWGINEFFV
tara:strand:+ start:149 stop:1147 length:999 start_codon:yes stop_codon:yes gene_type:complete